MSEFLQRPRDPGTPPFFLVGAVRSGTTLLRLLLGNHPRICRCEEFERSVFKEPGPNGKYIVNGDTALADRKHLREFFEVEMQREPTNHEAASLAVVKSTGIWNGSDRKRLTYCISSAFGIPVRSANSARQFSCRETWQDARKPRRFIFSPNSTRDKSKPRTRSRSCWHSFRS